MKVRIAANLFTKAQLRRELVKLVDAIERGHVIVPEPLDAPEPEAWLADLGLLAEEYRTLLELALEDAANRPLRTRIQVVDQPVSDWESDPPQLTLDDALGLLHRPLKLLVENKRNDRAFLEAVGWRYAETLEQLEKQRRLEWTQGGGITEMIEELKANKDPSWRQQTFAVFDSDALSPGCPSKESKDLLDRCLMAGVGCHQLRRRAAENYLPPTLLIEWARSLHGESRKRSLKTARAFDRLNPQQRYHYNMKKGHRGDARRGDRHPVRALFASTDNGTAAILDEGFGDRIRDLFHQSFETIHFEQDDQQSEMTTLFEALLERV